MSRLSWKALAPLALITLPLVGQRGLGELRITIKDPLGLVLEATGSLVGQSVQVRRAFSTDTQGRHSLRALPFGMYRLQVECPGFSPFSSLVEVRSETPVDYRVTLGVTPIETTVQVSDFDTLLDPHRTGSLNYLGADT